ncbi:MAG: hypothetical protein NZM38_10420 [Cytophagales bacterium]|nr:hypothetical protein [Cytophagales bacterium]MDW8385168.1 hypothetical protein [Flammeovirgaceae bacterium]
MFFQSLFQWSVATLGVLTLLSCRKNVEQTTSSSLEVAHNEAIAAHKSSDPTYLKYEDSLQAYFGDLEIDLIIHYQQQQAQLKNSDDFAVFFRNTTTLKQSLVKRLRDYLVEQRNKDKNFVIHPIPWFKEIAKGMEIVVMHDTTYEIFLDYQVLESIAEKTEGNADDEFIKLMELCYKPHSYLPAWITPVSDFDGCSQLGSGKHLEALKQINLTLSHHHLFMREIAKIKNMLMSDLLFKKQYCESSKKVIEEIQKIIAEVELKESEIKMLKGRLQQFSDPKKYNIQFNCSKSNCIYFSEQEKGV